MLSARSARSLSRSACLGLNLFVEVARTVVLPRPGGTDPPCSLKQATSLCLRGRQADHNSSVAGNLALKPNPVRQRPDALDSPRLNLRRDALGTLDDRMGQ